MVTTNSIISSNESTAVGCRWWAGSSGRRRQRQLCGRPESVEAASRPGRRAERWGRWPRRQRRRRPRQLPERWWPKASRRLLTTQPRYCAVATTLPAKVTDKVLATRPRSVSRSQSDARCSSSTFWLSLPFTIANTTRARDRAHIDVIVVDDRHPRKPYHRLRTPGDPFRTCRLSWLQAPVVVRWMCSYRRHSPSSSPLVTRPVVAGLTTSSCHLRVARGQGLASCHILQWRLCVPPTWQLPRWVQRPALAPATRTCSSRGSVALKCDHPARAHVQYPAFQHWWS